MEDCFKENEPQLVCGNLYVFVLYKWLNLFCAVFTGTTSQEDNCFKN